MPRRARSVSATGVYHVMMRGINRQNIFEEDADCRKLLWQLKDLKELCGFELYAYCLMSNHIHLLIREGREPLATTMKRLGCRYVYWFNTKYQRVGHLFQDRFRSEAVENDAYFLTVLRYIHYNPVKAGLAGAPADYAYSSYRAYMGRGEWIDPDSVRGLLPGDEFRAFHEEGCEDECLDLAEAPARRLTDEEGAEVMCAMTGCASASAFQALEWPKRRVFIGRMREKGLSIRQISRLTGESYYAVQQNV